MNTLEHRLKAQRRSYQSRLIIGLFGGVCLLAAVSLSAYFTHVVRFRVEPGLAAENALVSVLDGVGLVFSERAYLLGEQAELRFVAPGFIDRVVAVEMREFTGQLMVEMQPAPIDLVITTEPSLPQTRWSVDGVYVATAERWSQKRQPGAVDITIDHEFFRPQTLQLNIPVGTDVERRVTLQPVAGSIHLDSEPVGAVLMINGENKGVTPARIAAVAGGLYHVQMKLDGYQPIEENIAVTNKHADIRRNYRFEPHRATVRVDASPGDGVLSVDGVVAGGTLLSLSVGKPHIVEYTKPGYRSQSKTLLLRENEHIDIAFQLAIETGSVTIHSTPAADILIDGKPMGGTPQTVQLSTRAHKITLSRPGYRTLELPVTPVRDTPLLIDERLETELVARLSEAIPLLTVAAGIEMKFFDPRQQSTNHFTMGAPAGEKGRRANEFQRQVDLTRPFYVSTTEITEEQFAAYKTIAVAGRRHPLRNVSWLEAVAFCNWLSGQDGLQLVYALERGQLHRVNPMADGYRLLSEAEWEWLARIAGRAQKARFVWGDAAIIPANSGNFADESAKGSVATYIPRYRDGFAGVAPVASFAVDAAGLYDMAGNVSEWVQDVYDLHPPQPGAIERDPFDTRYDDSRVIKGANFRSASAVGLRSSFREGLSRQRDDVGFRIARYLYAQQ